MLLFCIQAHPVYVFKNVCVGVGHVLTGRNVIHHIAGICNESNPSKTRYTVNQVNHPNAPATRYPLIRAPSLMNRRRIQRAKWEANPNTDDNTIRTYVEKVHTLLAPTLTQSHQHTPMLNSHSFNTILHSLRQERTSHTHTYAKTQLDFG